jgi:hypothetical protein
MILKIADSFLTTLSVKRRFQLEGYHIEHSQLGPYSFYEVLSPMEIPWLFQVDSARVLVIDQLSMEVV